MVESAFNRPTPVQEQQAALKAEPKLAPGEVPAGAALTTYPFSDEPPDPEDNPIVTHQTIPVDVEYPSQQGVISSLPAGNKPQREIEPFPLPTLIAELTAAGEIVENDPSLSAIDVLETREERELTEAEASAAIEAAMHERVKEALDRDLELRASLEKGDTLRVTLTGEEVAATRDMQPGEAWANVDPPADTNKPQEKAEKPKRGKK